MNIKGMHDGLRLATDDDSKVSSSVVRKMKVVRTADKLENGINDPEIRLILDAARRPYASAPADLVSCAKSMMQPEKRYLKAKLISSSLRMVGVRSLAMDKFQLVFESETVQARLLYMLEGKHWEVVGKVNDGEWKVSRPAGRVRNLGDGRFEFSAPALSDTGLILRRGQTQVDVPSAEEAGFAGCF